MPLCGGMHMKKHAKEKTKIGTANYFSRCDENSIVFVKRFTFYEKQCTRSTAPNTMFDEHWICAATKTISGDLMATTGDAIYFSHELSMFCLAAFALKIFGPRSTWVQSDIVQTPYHSIHHPRCSGQTSGKQLRNISKA